MDTGSSQKMRPNKMLERRSDSIGSKSALVALYGIAMRSRPEAVTGLDHMEMFCNLTDETDAVAFE